MKYEEFTSLIPLKGRTSLFSFVMKGRTMTEGHVLEFGVFKGTSINFLAKLCPGQTLYGFDSFEGLPEPWQMAPNKSCRKGHFNLAGQPPMVSANVKLIKGLFIDSLTPWKKDHLGEKISVLHIDSDLYSSAKYVLTNLDDMIVSGTIIVFDELCNFDPGGYYSNWEEGEWKALNEWEAEFGRELKAMARTDKQQGAVLVVK